MVVAAREEAAVVAVVPVEEDLADPDLAADFLN